VLVGDLVLHAPLYRPSLLTGDLATVNIATGGRLEIGLGSGYIERGFTGYGLPLMPAGQRVDILGEHLCLNAASPTTKSFGLDCDDVGSPVYFVQLDYLAGEWIRDGSAVSPDDVVGRGR
jgi:hypothetical protein